MRLARLISLAAVLGVALSAVYAAAEEREPLGSKGSSRAVRDFPAWKLLPTASYATLTDRMVGSKRWVLYVFKTKSQDSQRRVCLQTINIGSTRNGVSVLTGRPECGLLNSRRSFIASQAEVSRRTAIGVVTASTSTTSIEAELVPGGVFDHPTKALNQHQIRKSGLPLLIYSAFVADGSCLERLTGLDSEGGTVFSTGSRGCSDR